LTTFDVVAYAIWTMCVQRQRLCIGLRLNIAFDIFCFSSLRYFFTFWCRVMD